MITCSACNGTGLVKLPPTALDANPMEECKKCAGRGQVETPIGDPPPEGR